jgi:hypothetical protein
MKKCVFTTIKKHVLSNPQEGAIFLRTRKPKILRNTRIMIIKTIDSNLHNRDRFSKNGLYSSRLGFSQVIFQFINREILPEPSNLLATANMPSMIIIFLNQITQMSYN